MITMVRTKGFGRHIGYVAPVYMFKVKYPVGDRHAVFIQSKVSALLNVKKECKMKL